MKVFGIGLSKTGTTTLAALLNKSKIKTCHYPSEQQIKDIFDGKYDGACDVSIIPFYKKLHIIYPDAKFIYTIRNKEQWLISAERHFTKTNPYKIDEWKKTIRLAVYGQVEYDKKVFSDAYDNHDKNVKEYFKDKQKSLLILDICGGDLMEKLFSFLEIEHKNGHFPFPQRNKTKLIKLQGHR